MSESTENDVPTRRPTPCPKCSGVMEFGLLADRAGPGPEFSLQWIRGSPPNRWLTASFRTKRGDRYHVATLRCLECGFFERYASEEMQL